MVKTSKTVFISHHGSDCDFKVIYGDVITLAQVKWSPPDQDHPMESWLARDAEGFEKWVEARLDLELQKLKTPAGVRILNTLACVFDAPTQEDLELISADLARERHRMLEEGVPGSGIKIAILSEVARTLLAVAWAKLREKLKPVLRFWR